MVKIVLDAGHSFINTPGKRSPDGEPEWGFNNQVVQACIAKLETYKDVQVLRVDDPTGKTDVPLKTRTDQANEWNADVYVAVHHNANTGVWGNWTGVETYVMDSLTVSPESVALAQLVQPMIAKAMGLRDRGVKKANFHVLRETKMPAILTEGGFMDSVVDIKALRSKERLKAQGEALASALAAHFNLQLKQQEEPKPVEEKYEKNAPPSKGFMEEFQEAVSLGITNGTYPRRPATREEVAVMIVRALKTLRK